MLSKTGNICSVDTLVLILGKSPNKDQYEKIGPYYELLVLILLKLEVLTEFEL